MSHSYRANATEADRFSCMRCGRVHAHGGACEGCGDDPLLDLESANARALLVEEDDRRRSGHAQRIRVVAVAVGTVVVGAGCLFVPDFFTAINVLPFFLGIPLTGLAITLVAMLVFDRAFRFRFRHPYLRA